MNVHYERAKDLLQQARAKLPGLEKSQDPLDCFSAGYLDEPIMMLVEARSHMALGWQEDQTDPAET